jgi:hypothetical protein
MNAYKFTHCGSVYFYVGESGVKKRVADKQGKDFINDLNEKITDIHGNLVPGTVLDESFNIQASPEVIPSSKRLEGEEFIRYKVCDLTVINLYELDGVRLMGTRNSWGINNSKDLFESVSYGDAFKEALSVVGLDFEEIPLGTYGFSNPRIHMMANTHRVYSFTLDSHNDVLLEFDEASDEDTEFIEYYPIKGYYYNVVSKERETICNLLYLNRTRFRNSQDALSLVFCVLNYLSNVDIASSRYAGSNKIFNKTFINCRNYIFKIVNELDNYKDETEYYCVTIPREMKRINRKLNSSVYTFWCNVLTNAYNNAIAKDLRTFVMWK